MDKSLIDMFTNITRIQVNVIEAVRNGGELQDILENSAREIQYLRQQYMSCKHVNIDTDIDLQ